MAGKLTDYLAEVVEMKWLDFVKLERGEDYTAYEGVILGIIRSITKGSRSAIGQALDRLDGKVAENVEISYPKFRFKFVNATVVASGGEIISSSAFDSPSLPAPVEAPVQEQELGAAGLPSGELRPALDKMLTEPISVVRAIISASKYIDETGMTDRGNPSVKGVIVAHLVNYAISHKHSMGYASEILDQIDGKVATKINFMGGDVDIVRYDEIAPAGSYLDDNGVWCLDLPMVNNVWNIRVDDLHSKGRLRG